MIYHVLPGDGQVREFTQLSLKGELIVCREALVDGPIDAPTLDEFWQHRARFVLSEHGDDEIEYYEKVADPLNKLSETGETDEVNLWFEYELFCSVNMWFCLSLLAETGAAVYRVEPVGLGEGDRWDGFGHFQADDLRASFDTRKRLTPEDIALGNSLWQAYRNKDHSLLTKLGKTQAAAFPFLSEVVTAAVEQEVRPIETIRAITGGGETDFGKIFVEFRKRAGVYGYGDLQVQRLLDSI